MTSTSALPAPPSPPARRAIQDLPDELISQIAAGEVVERPASVVRELVDNALDAGARQITVRLLAGGVRLISVEDDGGGIPPAELPIALRRHATSKVRDLQELEGVTTMGFRGEALAAIASVSQTSILSRPPEADSAWLLDARSGELRRAARAPGTTLEVKELFFSTPARRKFLKTDATELAHCIESVRRHALARPDVGFAIWHEGKLVEQWRAVPPETEPSQALARRLADVLGQEFVDNSLPVHRIFNNGAITISGRAGLPDAARNRADQQYCYVNGRFVRDKVIQHAAKAAYEDVLHGHKQPIYALYVEHRPAAGGCERPPHQDRSALSRQPRSPPSHQARHRRCLAAPRAQRLAAQAKAPDASPPRLRPPVPKAHPRSSWPSPLAGRCALGVRPAFTAAATPAAATPLTPHTHQALWAPAAAKPARRPHGRAQPKATQPPTTAPAAKAPPGRSQRTASSGPGPSTGHWAAPWRKSTAFTSWRKTPRAWSSSICTPRTSASCTSA